MKGPAVDGLRAEPVPGRGVEPGRYFSRHVIQRIYPPWPGLTSVLVYPWQSLLATSSNAVLFPDLATRPLTVCS